MEVHEQYGDEVKFVGLPGLANRDEIDEFIAETGVGDIVHLPDLGGEIWRQFGVVKQRTYVFINDDGTWRRSGYGSLRDDVEALIAS